MKNYHQVLLCLIVLASGMAICVPASAQWSTSYLENNPIDTLPESMGDIQSVSDGNGGVLVVYVQAPGGGDSVRDVLAQRLDRDGNQVWPAPVVVLDVVSPDQILLGDLRIVSDTQGGAFIAMTVQTGGFMRVVLRALAADGSVNWSAAGLSPSPAATGFDQSDPELIVDNDDGVIVAWVDGRDAIVNGDDIWSQKIDQGGDLVWDAAGVPVCTEPGPQYQISIISDNDYGCYLAWTDYRSGVDPAVYGQRVLELGISDWVTGGINLLNWSNRNELPNLADGGPQGGFLMGCAFSIGGDTQAHVSRHNTDGSLSWGKQAGPYPENQGSPAIISDGQGGAFVAWADLRAVSFPGIHTYVQAISPGGILLWGADGMQVSLTSKSSNSFGGLVSDGAGGILIVWGDNHLGGSFYDIAIFGQRITNNGVRAWGAEGKPVSLAGGINHGSISTVSDGGGGFIASWVDNRFGSEYSGYAQRVGFHGKLGHAAPQITGVVDFPQDEGGVVRLDWTRSYLDDSSFADISEYTIWRRYGGAAKALTIDESEVAQEVERLAAATGLEPDFLSSQLLAGWSYQDQLDAYHWEEYAYDAATFADSTGAGVILTEFQVVAHESQFVSWASDPVAGYSVDNLAPGMPLQLTAGYASPDGVLDWSTAARMAPDLAGYRIYRSELPGFTPDAGTFVGTTADTSFVDVGLPAGSWHYRVTAEDFNGNESAPSNEAQLQTGVSAVGDETPLAFRLIGATPNPFNPATTLHFSTARAGVTTVKVFDTRGRLVRYLLSQDLAAGVHELKWDGRNEQGRGMPSGIYLVRVTSGVEHGVMKLLLAK